MIWHMEIIGKDRSNYHCKKITKAGVLSVSPSQLTLLDALRSNIRYNECVKLIYLWCQFDSKIFCFSPLIETTRTTASLKGKCFVVVETLGSNIIIYFIGILAWISMGINFCFHWWDNCIFYCCCYVSSKKKVTITVKINTK